MEPEEDPEWFKINNPVWKNCNQGLGDVCSAPGKTFLLDYEEINNLEQGEIVEDGYLDEGEGGKFSGEYSQEVALGPRTDAIRHNMHFLPVLPYLQNLTRLGMSLISRISVIMNVHFLRYDGILFAKGHCISLPQKMSGNTFTVTSC